MTIFAISDTTSRALGRALDGLDARQQATASNVANIETPGYQARVVRFEDSLRAAFRSGNPLSSSIETDRSMAPTRLNGNNVNLDVELMESSQTVLVQRLLTQSLSSKYSMMRTAISGR
ncbi:MAG: flagellar basal body rod protein FlgB [Ilumatobacter sp.]